MYQTRLGGYIVKTCSAPETSAASVIRIVTGIASVASSVSTPPSSATSCHAWYIRSLGDDLQWSREHVKQRTEVGRTQMDLTERGLPLKTDSFNVIAACMEVGSANST